MFELMYVSLNGGEVPINLDQYSDKAIILGDDFNTFLVTSVDKLGGKKEQKSSNSENIDGLCKEFSLVNIWRIGFYT